MKTNSKLSNRYKIVSLVFLFIGIIALFLPMGSINSTISNKGSFSANFPEFVKVAFDVGDMFFIVTAVGFIIFYAAAVLLTLIGVQSKVLGIITAILFTVFATGIFPDIHKTNPVRGLDFGIGFVLALAALLLYAINAHLKKKDDYESVIRDFKVNKWLILMAVPVAVYYFVFAYLPMYGVIIGFKNYSAIRGILASDWVGFKHLTSFFSGVYFQRTITNTLLISIYQLIFGFPAPIILALLLNEVHNKVFKRTIQTITYLPHFISLVVICGIIVDFFSINGLFNDIITMFGFERHLFRTDPNAYRPIYVGSGIWQSVGWGSIIYLAALSGINQELYEATAIEGAGRFKQFLHVTLPGITPMIVIMLILNIGGLMSEGSEKTILLYNELTYDTADIVSSYTYRRGLVQGDFSYSAAVGLFNTVINLILLVTANKISRKVGDTSLW